MQFYDTAFNETQLFADGWTKLSGHNMKTSGAFGHPYSIYKKSSN